MAPSDQQRGNFTYSLYFSLNTLPKDWLKNKRITDNHIQTARYIGMGEYLFLKKITCWLRLNLGTCKLNDYPLIRGMTSVIT